MIIRPATDRHSWDAFLAAQQFSPFLQSWTMGEVYEAIKQKPVRLEAIENEKIVGIAFAHFVPARRGRHLSVPYGPVVSESAAIPLLIDALKEEAIKLGCSFVRLSPFWPIEQKKSIGTSKTVSSPLHLLAEHLWYLPLTEPDAWSVTFNSQLSTLNSSKQSIPEETLFKSLRSTTRNLIRRAQKEGVTVAASEDPMRDLPLFIALHDETHKRHGFTPYTNSFFKAQLEKFAAQKQATLYLARYNGEVIAASIHMHFGGETSYHHGASTHKYSKIPASYLLQWTAITDALRRGDHVYNFWGIAPVKEGTDQKTEIQKKHPFAGVTLFKMGYGGKLLNLTHCMDIPLSSKYYLTRAFEYVRKWKRGF